MPRLIMSWWIEPTAPRFFGEDTSERRTGTTPEPQLRAAATHAYRFDKEDMNKTQRRQEPAARVDRQHEMKTTTEERMFWVNRSVNTTNEQACVFSVFLLPLRHQKDVRDMPKRRYIRHYIA